MKGRWLPNESHTAGNPDRISENAPYPFISPFDRYSAVGKRSVFAVLPVCGMERTGTDFRIYGIGRDGIAFSGQCPLRRQYQTGGTESFSVFSWKLSA